MHTISRNLNSFKHISKKPGALFLLAHNRKCPKLSMHFPHKPLVSFRTPPINNNNIAISHRCPGSAFHHGTSRQGEHAADWFYRSSLADPLCPPPPPASARGNKSPHPTFNLHLRSTISSPRHTFQLSQTALNTWKLTGCCKQWEYSSILQDAELWLIACLLSTSSYFLLLWGSSSTCTSTPKMSKPVLAVAWIFF